MQGQSPSYGPSCHQYDSDLDDYDLVWTEQNNTWRTDSGDDDSPMAGPSTPESLSDRARRRTELICDTLQPHRRVQPPQHEAQWADDQIHMLIGITGVTEENDPDLFTLMFDFPIIALILLSGLCTNYWCGVAALWLTETLADQFPETRSIPLRHDLFVAGLRDTTEHVMQCFHNRVSQVAFPLDPNPKTEAKASLTKIEQMIDKLWENGEPCTRTVHRPSNTSPAHMPSSLRHPTQATSTTTSTSTCSSWACPRSSGRSTSSATRSEA